MEELFATEYEFDLPRGYLDGSGALHRHGVMRLATAADEIIPLRDPRVVQNPGYLTVILLARVIEKLYSSDLAFLQSMYQRVNAVEPVVEEFVCPECGHKFRQEVNFTSAE